MNGELDPNAIAAEFLKQNLDMLFDGAKGFFKGAADKFRLHLDSTYRQYLTTLLEKYSKAKSFLLRGEAVPLYQFYVPLDLKTKNKTITAPSIGDLLRLTNNTIITGSAGCGKSMLVRHLLLNSLLSKTRVPIFVELRQFNTFDGDLFQLIINTLTTHKFAMDAEYIRKAIELGHFILFLDGYDEVAHGRRQHVRSTIHEFAKLNDKNAFILTSRPDPELEGWQSFSLAQVAPLSLDQAHLLVEKLPFDDKLKTRFLTDLRADLFCKHQSFLSNPLLLSIMLLSYGQSASIPTKLSVFYNQAYEALFERHDVLKNGFKRQVLSPLDIQDFARLFSAFCLQTYDKRKLEFTHTEALEYIESSQDIVGIRCNKDNYLKDLIQAVCLMVQDGLQIVYAHRSFQEYFVARFICEARPEVQEQLIKKYMHMVGRDSVFSMLHEMRPEIIEQHYILPGLDRLFNFIGLKRALGVSHHERFIRAVFDHFIVGGGHFGGVLEKGGGPLLDLTSFSLRRCGHLVGWDVDHMEKDRALAKEWHKRIGKQEIEVSKGPYGRQFIRDLAQSGGHFSIDMLKALLQIKSALSEKAQLERKTLESILREGKSKQ